MRTRETRADRVSTRDSLVEGGNGVRRVALKVCASLQRGDDVTLEVQTPAGIKTRSYGAAERVRVLK